MKKLLTILILLLIPTFIYAGFWTDAWNDFWGINQEPETFGATVVYTTRGGTATDTSDWSGGCVTVTAGVWSTTTCGGAAGAGNWYIDGLTLWPTSTVDSIIPTSSQDLGSSTSPWNALYAITIQAYGDLNVIGTTSLATTSITRLAVNTSTAERTLEVYGDVRFFPNEGPRGGIEIWYSGLTYGPTIYWIEDGSDRGFVSWSEIFGIQIGGDNYEGVQTYGDVKPSRSEKSNVGTSTKYYLGGYFTNLYVSSTLDVTGTSSFATTAYFQGNISMATSGDAYIYFNNLADYILWDDGGDNFFFSNDITTNNAITAATGTFGNIEIPTLFTNMTEPTGFVDKTATLSFDTTTRIFTITGNHDIYIYGVKTTKGTASTTIADTTGLHWIYYDAAGTLSESTVAPGFAVPTIATAYWNTVIDEVLLGEERHGIKMDVDTHSLLHYTVGTRYESGLTGTFADTNATMTAGIIDDEDIPHSIGATSTFNVLYKNGATDFQWDVGQSLYYKLSGTDLLYNNGNATATVGANQYVAYWIFATNDTENPLVSLMGQRTDVIIANARINNKYESLTLGTLPFQEMKLLYRVILRNDGTPYEETQDLRSVSNLPAGTYLATQHNVLTGLDYDSSGHTGFASSGALTTYLPISASSSFAWRANNLLDLTNTSTARINLGLVIGTDVQAYDADNATTGTPIMTSYDDATTTLWDASYAWYNASSTTLNASESWASSSWQYLQGTSSLWTQAYDYIVGTSSEWNLAWDWYNASSTGLNLSSVWASSSFNWIAGTSSLLVSYNQATTTWFDWIANTSSNINFSYDWIINTSTNLVSYDQASTTFLDFVSASSGAWDLGHFYRVTGTSTGGVTLINNQIGIDFIDISGQTNLTAGAYLTLSGDSVVLDPEIATSSFSMISIATTSYNGSVLHSIPYDYTITRVSCFTTDTGSSTIQLDERGSLTPRTGGTDVLTAVLVCGSSASTTAFDNAGILGEAWLNLDIDSVDAANSTGTVIVNIYYFVND